MRIQHNNGDATEVDWAGATSDIHDPIAGEVSKDNLFVAVLPCSCFTYVEALLWMRNGIVARITNCSDAYGISV